MAVRLKDKPFFLAAIICLVLFYSKAVKIPEKNPFISAFPKEALTGLSGMLISSPQKSASGSSYLSKMSVGAVKALPFKNSTLPSFSSALGNVDVIIPAELCEVYFPGKIYFGAKALKKGCYLYESGADYDFEGYFIGDLFFVKSCSACRWKKGFLGKIDKARALCRLHFKRLMFYWKDGGGLILALLSGSKEYLDSTLYSNFRRSFPYYCAFRHAPFNVQCNHSLFCLPFWKKKAYDCIANNSPCGFCLVCRLFSLLNESLYLFNAAAFCQCGRCPPAGYAFNPLFFLPAANYYFTFRP